MTPAPPTVVVYGATGYTGRLVVDELAARGAPLVLAGRNGDRLREIAAAVAAGSASATGALGAGSVSSPGSTSSADSAAAVGATTPPVVVEAPLDERRALVDAASRGSVLVNCAGPFARTGAPVLRAAIEAGAHYVDTTGEQDWIQSVLTDHDAALKEAGVAAVAGMGFDYLPGDLLCHLVGAPVAPLERLDLAYHLDGFGMTRGTQRSALEMLDGSDVVYENGRWHAGDSRPLRASVVFPEPIGRRAVGRYPAGEVVTVPRHLQVRTIAARISTTSVAPGPFAALVPYVVPLTERLMRTPLKGLLDRAIDRLPEGPTLEARKAAAWIITATATGEDGRVSRGVVRGTDVYGLTARLIADAAQTMGAPDFTRSGGLAPAQAFDPRKTLDALADFGVTYEVEAAGAGVPA